MQQVLPFFKLIQFHTTMLALLLAIRIFARVARSPVARGFRQGRPVACTGDNRCGSGNLIVRSSADCSLGHYDLGDHHGGSGDLIVEWPAGCSFGHYNLGDLILRWAT
jgi:hypothetical protein